LIKASSAFTCAHDDKENEGQKIMRDVQSSWIQGHRREQFKTPLRLFHLLVQVATKHKQRVHIGKVRREAEK